MQIIVNGGSMRPFLQHGQRLLVEKADAECLRAGDIVLFKKSDAGRLIVHRVRRIFRNGTKVKLLLRGDNVGRFDGLIDFSKIEGVVVARLRNGRVCETSRVRAGIELLLGPLLFRLRELAIFVLALWVRFMYSFIRVEKARYVDAADGFMLVYSWRGWPVCKRRSCGQTWVHPLFAKTSVLKEILQEQ